MAPGRIALLSFPVGTGVRIDANRRIGDEVDACDPLLAVVTAWGPDRPVALGRLRRALVRTAVVIEGGACNRTLLLEPARIRTISSAAPSMTGGSNRVLARRAGASAEAVVLLAAAVEAYEADHALAKAAFFAAAARGRPEQPDRCRLGHRLAYLRRGRATAWTSIASGRANYSIHHGSARRRHHRRHLDACERRITCGGRRHRLLIAATSTGFRVETDSGAHRVDREDGIVVRAGWPALVVTVHARPGMRVAAGDPIAVLESMKMETTVTAPHRR